MKRKILIVGIILVAVFLGWRFVRPLNIFIVTPNFERPIDTANAPAMFPTLRAEECGACHREFYDEWRTTIHAQAWTDPYFQVDWRFDKSQQICKNCHIPLDRQQEQRVLGFSDAEKWQPVLAPNPAFDPTLQHEGVTCTVCHLQDGMIVGVLGDTDAPHPVKQLDNPNRVCLRCHVVEGDRWDTFLRFPPCGTVAEIESTTSTVPAAGDLRRLAGMLTEEDLDEIGRPAKAVRPAPADHAPGRSGEIRVGDVAALGCVECHMPLVQRPLVAGGVVRPARRHLWRGGHNPAMVKQALRVKLVEEATQDGDTRRFSLSLVNAGAAHYLPTGTPDRHLTVELRLWDAAGNLIKEQRHTLKRTVMWRPFIIDLWDTRLPRWQPRSFEFEFPAAQGARLEAVVRYHLLDEARRQRIGYRNRSPIAYPVYQRSVELGRR